MANSSSPGGASSPPRLRLGQLLVDAKLITQEDLDAVLALQKSDGRKIGALLVERGAINETQLTQILSHQLSVPWVSLLHIEFSRQLLNLVPRDVAERHCLVPIYVRHVRSQGETLYVAMDDPTNDEALKACAQHSGLPVRGMIAPPTDIRAAIRVYYPPASRRSTDDMPAVVVPRPPPLPPEAPREVAPPAPPSAPPPAPESEPAVVSTSDLLPPSEPAEPPRALPRPPPLPSRPPPAPSRPPPPRPADADAPTIEAVEVEIPRKRLVEESEPPPPMSSRGVENIPKPRGRAPRMVSLTLLDGTTITLPARHRKQRQSQIPPPVEQAPEAPRPPIPSAPDGDEEQGLTARDLVSALRAVSHGADASEILGSSVRWEAMFAALLSLMLKKHLIADWEFVDELKKI